MKINPILLTGRPIKIDFFYFYPPKLDIIITSQYEKEYGSKLGIFFLTKEDMGVKEEDSEGLSRFDIVRLKCMFDEKFKFLLLSSLEFFTKEKFIFEDEQFILNDNILLEKHWTKLVDLLAEENSIDKDKLEKEDFNPINAQASEIKRKIEETRKLVNQYKKSSEDELIYLISAYCERSPGINILEIWDWSLYQFRLQFQQCIKGENFDSNLQAIFSGANPKKIKLVHWTENK